MEEDQLLKILYSRYVKNQCTREELQLFFRMVRKLENEEDVRSMLSRTWDEWEEDGQLPAQGQVRESFPRKKRWLRIAAVFALLVAGAWFTARWAGMGQDPVLVEHLAGPRQQLKILLPDSSSVWLQAYGRLYYRKAFDGETREVFLEGKAFFDVRENKQKQFKVHTGKITTTVLGTAFDIDAYAGDSTVSVTVVRGKVQVADRQKTLGTLRPSQQISYNRTSGSFRKNEADTSSCLARKQGKFLFEQMKLEQIARELEYWYGVEIKFANNSLRSCRYTASFDSSIDLEELLEILCAVNDIRYTINIQAQTVTLAGNSCGKT